MNRFFSRSLLLLLLLTMTVAAHSQAGGTVNAASCSQSDVQTALNSVTSTTTLVTIPSGTCAWTGNLTWTVPSGNTNLTIQGSTAVNCTGTPGTSSYACSATDQTIIQDSYASSASIWVINASGVNSTLRLTDLTIEGGTGSSKNDGFVVVYGPEHNLRIDHVHFNMTTYTSTPGTLAGRLYGDIEGVLDHNIYDNGTYTTLAQGFAMSNDISDTIGYGDSPWAAPTNFGTSAFVYIESSIMNGGMLEDCDTGGRFVARYNTLLNGSQSSSSIHTHGLKSQSGRGRSCRAFEAYQNYIVGPSSPANAFLGINGGTALVWGNHLVSGYNNFGGVSTSRNDGSEAETNTPTGWGWCGTAINGNGVGSAWDGNSPANSGYPCLDGAGRGQGDALNGQWFPNALNSVTGTIAWAHQKLEPVYFFDNNLPNGIPEVYIYAAGTGEVPAEVFNRDVYASNASFNGTTGTGTGTLTNRPSSCTAGPGGTYGASPTGSYGVAYWATDANGGQGELYVCTATNTWTPVYEPYTYPHPLVSGSAPPATSSTPPPPTNLSGTLAQ
jgi:hypothetical protein